MAMNGKVVVVTGSTCGIGLEVAKRFYRLGATVVLTCRDDDRGTKAIDAVHSSITPREPNTDRIHLVTLDLMVYESILDFTTEVMNKVVKVDVLVLNAGVYARPFEVSSYNVESHFATNMFGHYMIVNHLLPHLEAAAGRVIVVSSSKYKKCDPIPNRKQLMGEELWNYKWQNAYAFSKLATCIYTMELDRRFKVQKRPITVYAMHPGFIRGTDLGREYHWSLRALGRIIGFFFSKPVEKGAEPIVHLGITDVDELESGKLYNPACQLEDYFAKHVCRATSNWLWEMMDDMERLILQRGNFSDAVLAKANQGRQFAQIKC